MAKPSPSAKALATKIVEIIMEKIVLRQQAILRLMTGHLRLDEVTHGIHRCD